MNIARLTILMIQVIILAFELLPIKVLVNVLSAFIALQLILEIVEIKLMIKSEEND